MSTAPSAGTPPTTSVTWIEVDAGGLRNNLQAIRSLLASSTKLLAVVKANAYGHGPEAAQVLEQAGADMLATTTVDEAIAARKAGAAGPILVFAPLLPMQLPAALDARLTITVGSLEGAREASSAAAAAGKVLNAHLKIDTGMGRIGVFGSEALPIAAEAAKLPGLRLQGVYTHFGNAMEADLRVTRQQLAAFKAILEELSSAGLRPPIAHCANSAAFLQLPESHLDMVRVGTLIYGQYPASFLAGRLKLSNTWRMFSRIVSVKELPAGWTVGYGAEFRTTRPMRVAVIPVGYADGLAVEVAARSRQKPRERLKAALRSLKGASRPSLTIRGQRAPVVGRISMQMTTLDVSDIPDAAVGDVVEIPCRRVTSNPLIPRVLIDTDEAENGVA